MMGRTVRELLDSLDPRELSWWEIFAELEPFGPHQEELRAGVIAALIHNQGAKQGRGPGDLFPSLKPSGQKKRTFDWRGHRDAMAKLVQAMGGEVRTFRANAPAKG